MASLFLQALQGQVLNPPPVWMMRQAGRYLPEYRELRATRSGFMDAALTPEVASEMTLQPIRRFPELDAAIIFSDILVTPYALGMDVQFVAGEGPQMPALDVTAQELSFEPDKLKPIYDALKLTKSQLSEDKALIGFAGSPWTVACYMISGSNHDGFSAALRWAKEQPDRLDELLSVLSDATVHYLLHKIKYGADALQLFESWAGLLDHDEALFERFVIKPTRNIVKRIRAWYPHVPIIAFPRLAHRNILSYAQIDGLNGLSLDCDVDIAWAAEHLPAHLTLQGNLDPQILLAGGDELEQATKHILNTMRDRPFIFNLGHGIIKETPPEHVAHLLSVIKSDPA
jgi:uroporphyrinogen decarboxylase